MKLLITAFRPFGKRKVNTSEDVLQNLQKSLPRQNAAAFYFFILPVNFRTAWPTLSRAIRDISPDAILMLGEKRGNRVTIETTAHNRRRHKTGEIAIENTNRKKLRTTFAVAGLTDASQNKSAHAKEQWIVSHNAGNHLCNFSFWKILSRKPELPAIFLHVPALKPENSQTETARIAQQVNDLINAMKKQLRNMQSQLSAQKQLTVPRQKAGRAKRKKES